MTLIERIAGPRVPDELKRRHPERYRRPDLLFGAAGVVLVISVFFPYWHLYLKAPQFPGGLEVRAYMNRLQGDVELLEGLNHYIGMRSFQSGAVFERTIAFYAIAVFAGLIVASLFINTRWVVLFVAPALVFPFVFLADLQFWLWRYGHELDPRAPFADAVGEFTPHLFGPSTIAQFDTNALPGIGLLLAFGASILAALGLYYHRKAFRPLVEAWEAGEDLSALDGEIDEDERAAEGDGALTSRHET